MNHDTDPVPERHVIRPAPDPGAAQLGDAQIGDAEVVARVQAAGPGSNEYRYLKHSLEELAIGTLTNLEKKRKLHAAILTRGCRLCRPIPATYPENFRTLLHLAVCTASPKFMGRQILEGGWRPGGHASVGTFFVSAAMYQFATEYNRFWHEEFARSEEVLFDPGQLWAAELPSLTARLGADPEATAVARETIASIAEAFLRSPEADPRWKTIVVRTAQQYTQAEIADELGMSAEAVSSAIRRLRRRIS